MAEKNRTANRSAANSNAAAKFVVGIGEQGFGLATLAVGAMSGNPLMVGAGVGIYAHGSSKVRDGNRIIAQAAGVDGLVAVSRGGSPALAMRGVVPQSGPAVPHSGLVTPPLAPSMNEPIPAGASSPPGKAYINDAAETKAHAATSQQTGKSPASAPDKGSSGGEVTVPGYTKADGTRVEGYTYQRGK